MTRVGKAAIKGKGLGTIDENDERRKETEGTDLCALQHLERHNFKQPAWKSNEKLWKYEGGEIWRIAGTGDGQ